MTALVILGKVLVAALLSLPIVLLLRWPDHVDEVTRRTIRRLNER